MTFYDTGGWGVQQKMTDDNDSSFRGRGYYFYYQTIGIKHNLFEEITCKRDFNHQEPQRIALKSLEKVMLYQILPT